MDRDNLCADTAKTAAALRSQLNQMAAASQVLERNTESEKGRSYLSIINQSICRMLRIVGRMELGSRLSGSSSGLCFAPKYMDLTPWLEDLCGRLQSILAGIGITFTLRCPDRLYLLADGGLLQQMLLELAAHMALLGTDITLTVSKRSDSVYFSLKDSGPGSAEGRPALPSQLETDEERLSLDLARQIAALHGGSLVVSADAGLGLDLAVSLPIKTVPSGHFESPQTPWQSGGFDPVLVALSHLLPARSFSPDMLG